MKSKTDLVIDDSWTLFLDRDGVINERIPGDYIRNWKSFNFLDGVVETIAQLSSKFGRIIVVTNQQGVGKGLMTKKAVEDIHKEMLDAIHLAGGKIDAVYYCPELATDNPDCRKPNVGMALQAKKGFPDIDFEKAVMVGDSVSDMEFGMRLGMITVFITTKLEYQAAGKALKLDFRLSSLSAFADQIFK